MINPFSIWTVSCQSDTGVRYLVPIPPHQLPLDPFELGGLQGGIKEIGDLSQPPPHKQRSDSQALRASSLRSEPASGFSASLRPSCLVAHFQPKAHASHQPGVGPPQGPLGAPPPARTRPLPSAPAAAPVSMGTKVANRSSDFRSAQTTTRARAAPEWAPDRNAEGQDPLCGALRGEAGAGGAASRACGGSRSPLGLCLAPGAPQELGARSHRAHPVV